MAIVALTMLLLVTTLSNPSKLMARTLNTLKICAKPKHVMVGEHTLDIVVGKPQTLAFSEVLVSF